MPGTSIVQKLQIKPNRTALFVDSREELEEHVPRLKAVPSPAGVFRVTYPKGSSEVDRDGIASYAKTIGMQAVAQIAVGADRSALRFKTV